MWPQVGPVDLVLTWASRGGVAGVGPGVHPGGGVQGVLEAWFCRWKAEVVHRLYKQNLGQGKSQARSFAAQPHAQRAGGTGLSCGEEEVREACPGMAWRHAQRVAGNRLLTESKATSPPGKRPGKGVGGEVKTPCSISSDDEAATKEKKTKTLLEGQYRLVYLSPERIRIKGFIEEFKKELGNLPVSAVTVDEAHCVSEWGHDFRPAYLHIRSFYEGIQAASPRKLPLIALTATASPPVRRDILRVLGLPEGAVEQLASSDRPNLSFSVHTAPLEIGQKRDLVRHLLKDALPRTLGLSKEDLLGGTMRPSYPHAGVIFAIYADPRGQNTFEEGVHAIRNFLLEDGLVSNEQVQVYASKAPEVCPFCGSSDWFPEKRDNTQGGICRNCNSFFTKPKTVPNWEDRMREVQDRFQENRFPLLIATKGYGMGVDKRNIRYIIHHAMSSGLEGYYQEAGRAGRDGRHAHVALVLTPPAPSCLKDHVLGGDGTPPCVASGRARFCPYGLTAPCDYARQLEFLRDSYPGVEASLKKALEVAEAVLNRSEEGRDGQRFVDVKGSNDKPQQF